jgi:hypothetical protein
MNYEIGSKQKCCTIVVPNKKAVTTFGRNCLISRVVMDGIEPPTQGFSVLCSTN